MKIIIALASAGLLVLPGPILSNQSSEEPAAYVLDLSSAPLIEEGTPAPDAEPDPAPTQDQEPIEEPTPSTQLAPADELEPTTTPEPDEGEPALRDEPLELGEPTAKTASLGGFDLITAPLETPEFAVAGVTWEGTSPDTVDIRVLTGSEWSDWYSLEIELDEGGNPGTEPYMAAGASGIQVRASGPTEPANFQVILNTGEGTGGTEEEAPVEEAAVEPEPDTEDALAENVSSNTEATFLPSLLQRPDDAFIRAASQTFGTVPAAPVSTSLILPMNRVDMPAPKVMSRAEWGVGPSTIWPAVNAELSGAVIHHTAGHNDYAAWQGPSIVKGIWNYHTYGRGWGDIGYNFLVDKYGNIYEGRTGSLASSDTQMPIGAHAAPGNTGSVGISVMGNYTSKTIEPAALEALADVIAWQFGRAGVDPHGTFTYRDRAGISRSIAAINGHKDIANTACPANIYPELGKIRTMTKDRITAASAPSIPTVPSSLTFSYSVQSGHGWPADSVWGVGDFAINGYSDLILRSDDGKLLFYDGQPNDRFVGPRQIGHGWNGMADLFTGFDFDGDGLNDIIGLRHDGKLFHYAGRGDGTVRPARQIGHGWRFEHMFGVESGPDGRPAFVGIKPDGDMYIYRTNGAGTFAGTTHYPGNYSHLVGAVGVGDWDDSGFTDAVVIGPNHELFFHSDVTEGGYAKRSQIGQRWGAFDQLEVAYSTDNVHRLWAIRNDGKLFTYAWENAGQ